MSLSTISVFIVLVLQSGFAEAQLLQQERAVRHLPDILANTERVLSFSMIEQLVSSSNVSSIEQLLPLLPAEFRSQAAFVSHSKSTQFGSPSRPRVILFGDPNLMVAFSGEPQARGFNKLEVIEFNSQTQKFDFHEIEFKNREKALVRRHATSCTACHGPGLHPNWRSYPHWPNVFGSLHLAEAPKDDPSPTHARAGFLGAEALDYDAFRQFALTDPRYSMVNLPRYHYLSVDNELLTHRIRQNQNRMIAAELKKIYFEHPQYRKALIAALASSMYTNDRAGLWSTKFSHTNFIALLPENDRRRANERIQQLTEETDIHLGTRFGYDLRLQAANRGMSYEAFEHAHYSQYSESDRTGSDENAREQIARIRFIIEDKLHLSISHWFLNGDARNASYATFTGTTKSSYFQPVLVELRKMLPQESLLQPFAVDAKPEAIQQAMKNLLLAESCSPLLTP